MARPRTRRFRNKKGMGKSIRRRGVTRTRSTSRSSSRNRRGG